MNAPDDNITPPSPQAAALAKYVQVPVGLYTGVPQINIPLWELHERDVSLPVSLSYHAGGNRVDELATRVGLGWTMQAGGAVSRVVRGQADEADLGFLYFCGIYTNSSMHTGTDYEKAQRYKELSEGCLDSEPDLFSFNINGLTGTFAFNWDRSIMIASEQKVKIKANFTGSGIHAITSWELTGPDGTVYLFQDREVTNHVPILTPSMVNDPLTAGCIEKSVVSSWYVTKITPANNLGFINFTYREYLQQYYLTNSEQIMHRDLCGTQYPSAPRKERKIEITGKDLVKIETSSGMIVEFIAVKTRADIPPFSSSNPPQSAQGSNTFSLDTVVVKNNSTVVRRFAFEYDQSTGRLTLKKVRETGPPSTQQKPPYIFSYSPIQLPPVNSYSQDHWGYLNANGSGTLIPPARLRCYYSNTYYSYGGGDRSPHADLMKAGILTKIQYPAGGSTSFEYDPHDHSYSVTEVVKVPRYIDAHASTETENLVVETQSFTLNQQTNVEFSYGVGNGQNRPITGDPTIVPTIELRKDGTIWFAYRGQPINTSVGWDLPPGNYTLSVQVWMPYDYAFASVKYDEPSGTPITRIITDIAGGLRVRSITDMDGMGQSPAMVRKFIYKMDDGSSSGYGQATQVKYEYDYRYREDPNVYEPSHVTVRMASNCYMHSLTQGSTVGYRQVTTLFGESGQNGKNVSKFVSPYEVADLVSSIPPFPAAITYDYKRGALLESTDYKYVNGAYVATKKVQNAYVEKETTIDLSKVGLAVGGVEVNTGSLGAPFDVTRYALSGYQMVFGVRRPSQTIETIYENGKSYATQNNTSYDANLQFVKSTVKKVSNSKDLVTDYFYPQDFVYASPVINELKTKHNFPMLEQVTYERGTDGIKKAISGAYMQYALFGQWLLPSKSYKLTTAAPVTNFATVAASASGTVNPAYAEVSSFNTYDTQGNIVQVKSRDSENETYLWGYNKTLVVAKVQNAALNQVAYCDFEDSELGGFTFSTASGNYSTDAKTGKQSYKGPTITCNIPQAHYKLSLWAKAISGTAKITVNGMNKNIGTDWTYCEWEVVDPNSIIINVNQYYVGYTGSLSITTNGNLVDGIRLHPKSALMETYTYEPMVGLTSFSTSNNTITYYEYDGLGRLQAVRDEKRNILKSYQYQYTNQ